MKKENCNFKDEELIIYNDKLCYSIISRTPINKYHTMIIPKEHYKDFIDVPDELASHIFLVTKKISKAVRKACNPDAITHISDDDITNSGYNLTTHFKFHILPRFKEDLYIINWKLLRKKVSDEARSEIAKEIKYHLK